MELRYSFFYFEYVCKPYIKYWGFFQIYDGRDTHAAYLGRFCRNRESISVVSTGDSLLFVYKISGRSWFTQPNLEFEMMYEATNITNYGKNIFPLSFKNAHLISHRNESHFRTFKEIVLSI